MGEPVTTTTATGAEPAATLLISFANTLDLDEGTDRLDTNEGLRDWLVENGLTTAGAAVTSKDLAVAVRLRTGLREAMRAHHEGDEGELQDLDDVTADLPLRLSFRSPSPSLEPAVGGVRGGLATVLAAVVSTAGDGTWDRLKICSADDCLWAFVDRSRNRSRTWCAMGVCGNRAKTRSYRARRRGGAGDARGSHGDGA